MTNGKHPNRFGSLRFETPASAPGGNPGIGRARVILHPGQTVLATGKEVAWSLKTWAPPGEPLPIRLEAVLSGLSPLPPATITRSVTFDAHPGLELRDILLRLVVPPGRYRLLLSACGHRDGLVTEGKQLVFVHEQR